MCPFYFEGNSSRQVFAKLIRDMIISCDIDLTECELTLRAVISDNRSTNVSTYKDLLKHYPVEGNNYSILNPKYTSSEIYLLYTILFI